MRDYEGEIKDALIRKRLIDMSIKSIKGTNDPREDAAVARLVAQSKELDERIASIKEARGDAKPPPTLVKMKAAEMGGNAEATSTIDPQTAAKIQGLELAREVISRVLRETQHTPENEDHIKSLQGRQREINEEILELKKGA